MVVFHGRLMSLFFVCWQCEISMLFYQLGRFAAILGDKYEHVDYIKLRKNLAILLYFQIHFKNVSAVALFDRCFINFINSDCNYICG